MPKRKKPNTKAKARKPAKPSAIKRRILKPAAQEGRQSAQVLPISGHKRQRRIDDWFPN